MPEAAEAVYDTISYCQFSFSESVNAKEEECCPADLFLL
jgi:hypothetical protein